MAIGEVETWLAPNLGYDPARTAETERKIA
jgi:hypothetical protein